MLAIALAVVEENKLLGSAVNTETIENTTALLQRQPSGMPAIPSSSSPEDTLVYTSTVRTIHKHGHFWKLKKIS